MAKIVAMYFPQFHAIEENDQWWGKGFTDWVNVKKANPQFKGHYHPRVPLNNNYYDQSDVRTLQWQVSLAREYGVYGFCHYHYWFDGKHLLHKPTDLMLSHKDIDFPFCLSWANETWSRKWDGRDHSILIRQTHIPEKERWKRHFDYLVKVWSDERAIKVDGRPIFVIYRPNNINQIDDMLDFWRKEARRYGLEGVYFIAQKQYEFPSRDVLRSFDAIFQFNPFESIFFKQMKEMPQRRYREILKAIIPNVARTHIVSLLDSLFPKLTFYNYDEVWSDVIKIRNEPGITTFPGGFVDWDNTARYRNRATLFRGSSPESFERWMRRLINTMEERNLPEDYIFLNAWNEWAESAYLEPDEKNGYGYLKALKNALDSSSRNKNAAKDSFLARKLNV